LKRRLSGTVQATSRDDKRQNTDEFSTLSCDFPQRSSLPIAAIWWSSLRAILPHLSLPSGNVRCGGRKRVMRLRYSLIINLSLHLSYPQCILAIFAHVIYYLFYACTKILFLPVINNIYSYIKILLNKFVLRLKRNCPRTLGKNQKHSRLWLMNQGRFCDRDKSVRCIPWHVSTGFLQFPQNLRGTVSHHKQRQGVTSVRVTSLGFLEAELLVGEADGGVQLSRIMHRSPHPCDFVPSHLCPRFPSLLPSLEPLFLSQVEGRISMLLTAAHAGPSE